MSAWLPLLRLDVAHGYFADGRSRGLHFEPADNTARRLRRADVLTRQDGASLWLIGAAEAADHLLDDDASALTWLVRATEPQFAIYTGDPSRRPRELVLMQADEADAPLDAELDAPLALPWRIVPVAQPQDLATVGPALALAGEAAWRPPFALLRVTPGLLRARPRASRQQPLHLQWSLPPRTLVWKYCLIGDWPEDAIDVHDPAGQLEFHPPAAGRLDDGRPLLALRSRAPIALTERASARLQLRCRQAGLPRVLVKRLPVPGPQHLAREEIDGATTLVSEIHVHR